jgi:hypothetical protein
VLYGPWRPSNPSPPIWASSCHCVPVALRSVRCRQSHSPHPPHPSTSPHNLTAPSLTPPIATGLSLFQYPLFLSFLRPARSPEEKSLAGKPFSLFWSHFFLPSVGIITSSFLTTALSGFLCARWLRTHATLETTDVSKFYTYGAVLALAHGAFIPLVAGPIKRVMDAGGKDVVGVQGEKGIETLEEGNRREMRTWFLWHSVRTVLVDVPALWCFAEGVALSFWVV